MHNSITTYDVTCLYVYTFMHHVLGREQGQTITIGWRNDWERKKKRTKIEARPAPSRGQFLSIRVYIVFSVKRKKVRWKKENPPQDLTRLCRGAKGHLMNNGWWRNGNQFLSKPLRLLPLLLWGPGHVSSSNHMCFFFSFILHLNICYHDSVCTATHMDIILHHSTYHCLPWSFFPSCTFSFNFYSYDSGEWRE